MIGSYDFRKSYCEKMVDKCVDQIKLLSEIALMEPETAYSCFIYYQHKLHALFELLKELKRLDNLFMY